MHRKQAALQPKKNVCIKRYYYMYTLLYNCQKKLIKCPFDIVYYIENQFIKCPIDRSDLSHQIAKWERELELEQDLRVLALMELKNISSIVN